MNRLDLRRLIGFGARLKGERGHERRSRSFASACLVPPSTLEPRIRAAKAPATASMTRLGAPFATFGVIPRSCATY